MSGAFRQICVISSVLAASLATISSASKVHAQPAAPPAASDAAPTAPAAPPAEVPPSAAAEPPAGAAASPPAETVPPAAATPAAEAAPPVAAAAPAAAGGRGSVRLKAPEVPASYDGPPLLLGRGKKVHVGGYAGVGGAYTRFIGRDSGLVSFEAALLLDHRLSLGVAGYGFTRTPRGPRATDGAPQELGAGYGGLALRYSVFFDSPLYVSFGMVLGAGAVNLHRDLGWDDDLEWDVAFRDERDWDPGRFDPFLFAQPELTLNANATRWLRFGVTGGYRLTSGVGRFQLDESELNGVVVGGNVQFGWF